MFEEIDIALFHADTYSGYFYKEGNGHELSMPSGRIFLHRYLMAMKLGRKLETNEHVHHIDGNRGNNDLSNLELLSSSEHKLKHLQESGFGKTESCCHYCGKITSKNISLIKKSEKLKQNLYCSKECSKENLRKFIVTEDWLKEMVWLVPTKQIAKDFGVSDQAVAKACKRFGIEKPPRGYWQKENPVPGVKKVILPCNCLGCGVEFLPTMDQMAKARRSSRVGPFCSRKCTGKYAASVRKY